MRKTKIICTIGPASENKEVISQMIDAGMNVARFNFSHSTYDEQKARMDIVKEVANQKGRSVGLLLDTKGPEVRVGIFPDGKMTIKKGELFAFTKAENTETPCEKSINISYPKLVEEWKKTAREVKERFEKGNPHVILADDGNMEFSVKEIGNDYILCETVRGGTLSNRKSLNFPDYHVDMMYLSLKDEDDIKFGLEQGIQYIAASFVRCAEDVKDIRKFVTRLGYTGVEIIAKIENQDGVDNLDEIIAVSDGLMVARGDMGVEIPYVKLPEIQKTIIKRCAEQGKIVITATQMLESMITHARPTRAEISDVANAVYDNTTCVMLSGESAAGMYPVESVKALSSICREAEQSIKFKGKYEYQVRNAKYPYMSVICHAVQSIVPEINASAIIAASRGGTTIRELSHFRPEIPILAIVTSEDVYKSLSAYYGVVPLMGEQKDRAKDIIKQAKEKAIDSGIVKKGDTVIILFDYDVENSNGTNTMSIEKI
ncbi:MAG: pyruvate kinase [Clostridia bacterium]|nr:pyruvate kinase [Clostridia bacterium]